MKDLILKEDVIPALVKKAQMAGRYCLGEEWELNYQEIEEAIREIRPIAQLKVVFRGEE